MDLRTVVEIFLPIVVLLVTSQIAHGVGPVGRFATPQCNHDQLVTAVGEMSTCETKDFHTFVERMLQNYKDGPTDGKVFDLQKACKITKEFYAQSKQCPVNFAKSCLPDYVAPSVEKMYDNFELNCDCPNPLNDPSCMLKDQQATTNPLAEGQTLLDGCEKDPKCPSELFTFDKQCTDTQMGEALGKAFDPCLKDPFEELAMKMERYFNGYANLNGVSPCNTLRKVLDECFAENECFSQREMDMVRNMAATMYHRGMDSMVLVEKEFGSLTDFVASHNELTLKWNDYNFALPNMINVSDPTTTKVLDLADHIMKDYSTDACKDNQEVFQDWDIDELRRNGENGTPAIQAETFQLILTVSVVMTLKRFF